MKYIFIGIGIFLVIFSCLTALLESNNIPDNKKPKYPKRIMQLILLIGIIVIVLSSLLLK